MAAIEIEQRKKIVHTLYENPTWTQKRVAKHVGVGVSTVKRVAKKFRETLSVDRVTGSGRKSGPINKNLASAVKTHLKRNPNASVRDTASKVGASKSYVQKIKKNAQLKSYKVQKVPDRSVDKEHEAKRRARKLYEQFITKFECCIMDDETYVKGDFQQLPGQQYYVATAKGAVARKFKTQKQSKFPKKFLIWQAICTCGKKSEIFVTRGSINQQIYIEECLKKRLLPFLKSHNISTFFWPDLATSHYARTAMNWYEENGIHIVPKECNPPNCPELRPIERYWAMVKRNLKQTQNVVNNESQFKKKWKESAEKVKESTVQRMMGDVKGKVRDFFRNEAN